MKIEICRFPPGECAAKTLLLWPIARLPNNYRFELGLLEENEMRLGIATDHAGFGLKEELFARLRAAGHELVDFGAYEPNPDDDYPDFVIPLARAVVAGTVERGVAVCGSGVGASVCANKIPGIRAGLVHDHFSARQGVEDDNMNVICFGARAVGSLVAWDILEGFLGATFSQADRHRRRLAKVAALELERASQKASA